MVSSNQYSSFCALGVRIINQFVRGGRVKHVVASRRAARNGPRLFSTARFLAKFVPCYKKRRVTVRSSFRLVLKRITGIRDLHLLGGAPFVLGSEMLLVRMSVFRVNARWYSFLKHSVSNSRFRRDNFATSV